MRTLSLLLLLYSTLAGAADTIFSTAVAHRDTSTGAFSDARAALHGEILESFLAEGHATGLPVVVFTAGSPGTGKSHALSAFWDSRDLNRREFLVIDPDRVREKLPEYASFVKVDPARAAEFTHEEASYLSLKLIERAVSEKRSMVIDTSFASRKYFDVFLRAETDAKVRYHRILLTVQAHPDVVAQRIEARAKATGRGMRPEIFAEFERGLRAMEPLFRNGTEFDEIYRADTTDSVVLKAYKKALDPGEPRPFERPPTLLDFLGSRFYRPDGCQMLFQRMGRPPET